MSDWKESTGDTWKPKKDGDSVSGLLVGKDEKVGSYESMLYHIEDSKTHTVNKVWGSTILDDRMLPVKIGQEVRITYKGLGEASKGKQALKIFKVEYRDAEESVEQAAKEIFN